MLTRSGFDKVNDFFEDLLSSKKIEDKDILRIENSLKNEDCRLSFAKNLRQEKFKEVKV